MIKLKNILTENMLRFGVKNLSESDVTRLTEADAYNNVPAHMNILMQELNNQYIYAVRYFKGENWQGKYLGLKERKPFFLKKPQVDGPGGTVVGPIFHVMYKTQDGKDIQLDTDRGFGNPTVNIQNLANYDKDRYTGAYINGLDRLISQAKTKLEDMLELSPVRVALRKTKEIGGNKIQQAYQKAVDSHAASQRPKQ